MRLVLTTFNKDQDLNNYSPLKAEVLTADAIGSKNQLVIKKKNPRIP